MDLTTPHRVTLVLGGARSGKSRYAQQLADRQLADQQLADQHLADQRLAAGHLAAHRSARQEGGGRVLLLATATAGDDEMRRKIAQHQADRTRLLSAWTVREEPLHVGEAIAGAIGFEVVVVDCLTLFAAEILGKGPSGQAALERLYAALSNPPCSVVLVSNEVGSGVVPEWVSGRAYRDLLGEINQRVAALANDVLLMVAGLPLALKGVAR